MTQTKTQEVVKTKIRQLRAELNKEGFTKGSVGYRAYKRVINRLNKIKYYNSDSIYVIVACSLNEARTEVELLEPIEKALRGLEK